MHVEFTEEHDALRTVVNAQYVDFLDGTTFHCQALWNLMAEQPGFDADKAIPPFCLFKSWESKLNLDVLLPAELGPMSHMDRSRRAGEIKVPEKQLNLVFDPNNEILAATTEFTVQASLQRWLGDEIIVEAVDLSTDEATVTVEVVYLRRDQLQRGKVKLTF